MCKEDALLRCRQIGIGPTMLKMALYLDILIWPKINMAKNDSLQGRSICWC